MGRPSKFVVEMEQRIAAAEMDLIARENRLAREIAERDMLRKHLEDDKAILLTARSRSRKKGETAASAGTKDGGE